MIPRTLALIGGVLLTFSLATPAYAQIDWSQRVAVEFVGAITTTSTNPDDPFIVLDGTATVRLASTVDVIVRPWFRRLPGGDTSKEMYQLQVRYQPTTKLPVRIDAGIIASPLGIIALEMRPDRNPIIGSPSYYFSPLPSFDGRLDRVQLLSGGYPLGAIASVSGRRWDARAGVTDGTPARNRKMISSNRPQAEPQFVAGGGVTPSVGLRLGAGFARGVYRDRASAPTAVPLTRDARATVFNVEGEYSVGYSRFAGEWIVDSFETATTPAVARGYLLEAVQTLTPRIWAAARTTHLSTPVFVTGLRVRRTGDTADATLGYRVTPGILFKVGYQGSRPTSRVDWDHAVAVSAVWTLVAGATR
jgi:hypothetical protein